MRHYLLAVFACLSVFLTAATPAFTIVPTVIVYPMTTSNSLGREDAARIMTTLANQIAQGGQVKVIPPASGIERENYLANARSVGANFYVTGFITPLGQGASVVEQVVSTTSGTLVFSVTNYITSLAEIAAQGDQLRMGILERSSRGIAAFTAPPPPPANTPAPEASNAADVNINKLFGRKTAPAAAIALAPPANTTLAVLAVGGSADPEQRTAAARAIVAAFDRAGRHAVLVDSTTPSNANCTSSKAAAQVAAWLDPPSPNAANGNVTLRMIAYDCAGKVAFDRTFKQPPGGVTDAAVGAYLNPPKRRA